MRADLLDAYAAADWAVSHLEGFDQRLKAWVDSPPYAIVEEDHPEVRKKLLKLRIDDEFPLTFNAEVGAIVNTVRTSLDLLAAALAVRNGKKPSADTHFPIYPTVCDFIDPLNVAKRKRWLSDADRTIIESLKPYQGGNDRLFALHHFDVIRKHERLLAVRIVPVLISLGHAAYQQGLEFPTVAAGFKDDAVIAWTDINATDSKFQMTLDVTFNEGALVDNEPIRQALRDFWRLATMVIELFE